MDRLISERAVIESIEFFQMNPQHFDFVNLIDDIKEIPSAEPKTGHWISDAIQGEIDGQIVKAFICSECGAISVFRITDGKIVNGDLCPNCGAKMESREKEWQEKKP